jgi:aminoglycoside 6'-N-acetyltransferase I
MDRPLSPQVTIRPARGSDLAELASLYLALWPEVSLEEHASELNEITGRSTGLPSVNLIAETMEDGLAGFLQVSLRSHADGCDPSRPVGFIEGWYVIPACRRRGIGRKLLAAAEDWARNHRCKEMASDTQIDNEISQTTHQALGYQLVDRCVHFRKSL